PANSTASVATISSAFTRGKPKNSVDATNKLDSSEMVFFILIHLHSFLIFTPARLESILPPRAESILPPFGLSASGSANFDSKSKGWDWNWAMRQNPKHKRAEDHTRQSVSKQLRAALTK